MLNKFCEMLANVGNVARFFGGMPRVSRTRKRESRNGTRVNTLSKVEDYFLALALAVFLGG
jgi:hypothetical protein